MEKLREPSEIGRSTDINSRCNITHSLQRSGCQEFTIFSFFFPKPNKSRLSAAFCLLIHPWKLDSWLHFVCSCFTLSFCMEYYSGIHIYIYYIIFLISKFFFIYNLYFILFWVRWELSKMYPKAMKIVCLYSLVGTILSALLAIIIERDFSSWRLDLDMNLLVILLTVSNLND